MVKVAVLRPHSHLPLKFEEGNRALSVLLDTWLTRKDFSTECLTNMTVLVSMFPEGFEMFNDVTTGSYNEDGTVVPGSFVTPLTKFHHMLLPHERRSCMVLGSIIRAKGGYLLVCPKDFAQIVTDGTRKSTNDVVKLAVVHPDKKFYKFVKCAYFGCFVDMTVDSKVYEVFGTMPKARSDLLRCQPVTIDGQVVTRIPSVKDVVENEILYQYYKNTKIPSFLTNDVILPPNPVPPTPVPPRKRFREDGEMQVFFKGLDGKTTTLLVKPSTPILRVKDMYVQAIGDGAADASRYRFVFAGASLEDAKTLDEYKILKESTIHVVMRLCGC